MATKTAFQILTLLLLMSLIVMLVVGMAAKRDAPETVVCEDAADEKMGRPFAILVNPYAMFLPVAVAAIGVVVVVVVLATHKNPKPSGIKYGGNNPFRAATQGGDTLPLIEDTGLGQISASLNTPTPAPAVEEWATLSVLSDLSDLSALSGLPGLP